VPQANWINLRYAESVVKATVTTLPTQLEID